MSAPMPAETLDSPRVVEPEFPDDPAEALEMLMQLYGNMVLRLAYMYVHDRQWAEDISQEVFVRAYRYWRQFRRESSVKTWLCRITTNCCQDRMRSRSFRETPVDDMPLAHGEGNAEAEALAKLEGTVVLKHVQSLPEAYREAVFLFYYCDMSIHDIAVALNCQEVTVRSRLHRGREALRRVLEREGFSHERSG